VGLPRLVIVDADSLFAGLFKQLFQLLLIPVDAVSRENHKAVRNERFHRYLNKVQRVNTADVDSLFRWKQGVLFSLYTCNAAPIDGTDLPRSSLPWVATFLFQSTFRRPLPATSMWTDGDTVDERNNDSSSEYGVTTSILTSLTKTTLTRLPPSVPHNETTRTVLKRLFRQVSDSSDALFFVSYTTDPAVSPVWRLGQVDKDDSSPSVATQSDFYRVRW
jgi:hypothetical protein